MFNALNTAATGMEAQMKQIETRSNNIANADTTGFKKSRADFQDLLYQTIKEPGAATSATTQSPTGIQIGVGVQVAGTTREHTDGNLKTTGRDLDVAISGSGFLAVQKANGDVLYTRDGRFNIDPEGRLVTIKGEIIVPEITVPPNTKAIEITTDGRVISQISPTERQEIGQLQLTTFANPSGLSAMGEGQYSQTPASGEAIPGAPGENGLGTLHQRYQEASNVEPVSEMTDMIRAQRVFEMNSKIMTTTDQMMQSLNQIR